MNYKITADGLEVAVFEHASVLKDNEKKEVIAAFSAFCKISPAGVRVFPIAEMGLK